MKRFATVAVREYEFADRESYRSAPRNSQRQQSVLLLPLKQQASKDRTRPMSRPLM